MDMEDAHYGGEGPYWAVVPLKKKESNTFIIMRNFVVCALHLIWSV